MPTAAEAMIAAREEAAAQQRTSLRQPRAARDLSSIEIEADCWRYTFCAFPCCSRLVDMLKTCCCVAPPPVPPYRRLPKAPPTPPKVHLTRSVESCAVAARAAAAAAAAASGSDGTSAVGATVGADESSAAMAEGRAPVPQTIWVLRRTASSQQLSEPSAPPPTVTLPAPPHGPRRAPPRLDARSLAEQPPAMALSTDGESDCKASASTVSDDAGYGFAAPIWAPKAHRKPRLVYPTKVLEARAEFGYVFQRIFP